MEPSQMANNTTSSNSSFFQDGCVLPENWTAAPFAYGGDSLIYIVSLPILFVCGFLGNSLTLIVLLRQNERWHTIEKCLTALAISDNLSLLSDPFIVWLGYIFETELFNDSEIVCKLHVYLGHVCFQFSAWLLAAFTMERLVCVLFPLKVREIVTSKRMTVFISLLAVFMSGVNAHVLFGFGHREGNNECWYMSDSYATFDTNVGQWISLLLEFVIPFIVILFSNAILVYKLARGQQYLQQTRTEQTARNRRPTIMVITLCVVFCVSMSPYVLCRLIWESWAENLQELWCTDEEEYMNTVGVYTWIVDVTTVASYINPSINFVLYVISGSRFREEVKALLMCKQSGNKSVFS